MSKEEEHSRMSGGSSFFALKVHEGGMDEKRGIKKGKEICGKRKGF